MKTIDQVIGRCYINESSCWIWRGAYSDSTPRISAPDYTKAESIAEFRDAGEVPMTAQAGRRAVWHIINGIGLPVGWRVYGTCENKGCVNPDHADAGPCADVGKQSIKTGRFKNRMPRILANRAIGRTRSRLTPELISEIQCSNETGEALSKRLNLGRSIVSRVRVHGSPAHQPIGSLFSGLMRSAA